MSLSTASGSGNAPSKAIISKDKDITDKAASLSGYRGHFTRLLNRAKNEIPLVLNNATVDSIAALRDTFTKMRDAYGKVEVCATELIELIDTKPGEDPQDAETFRGYLTKAETELNNATTHIMRALAAATGTGGQPAQRVRRQDDDEERQRPVKVVSDLRPSKLTLDNTPGELRIWIRKLNAFFTASNLKEASLEEQKAHLAACIDDKLNLRLVEKIDLAMNVLDGADNCVQIIKKEFSDRYPLFQRRLEYFTMKRKEGELCSDAILRVRAMGDDADLAGITAEDLTIFSSIRIVDDKKLREKLLDIPNPTLRQIDQTVRNFEANVFNEKSMEKSSSASAAAVFAKNKGKGKSWDDLKGKCRGCGDVWDSNHRGVCKAVGQTCNNCGIKNHLSRVCRGEKKKSATAAVVSDEKPQQQQQAGEQPAQAQQQQQQPVEQANVITGMRYRFASKVDRVAVVTTSISRVTASDMPTPRLRLRMRPALRNNIFSFDCLPDSGATRSIISMDVAKANKCAIRHTDTQLRAANGEAMQCNGKTTLLVIGDGSTVHSIDALVTSSMTSEVIISWHDLITLGVLQANFPSTADSVAAVVQPRQQQCEHKKVADILLQEFADVFKDRINPEPMAGGPMTIHLREDVEIKPKKCLTARQIPIHMQDDANALIKRLLEEKIIERVSWPTEWISPAFFVPKPSGSGTRLVTDFTGINRYIKRPVHPFPSSHDIMQNIPAGSASFMAIDAVQGYFHVDLDEASRDLTTFILPSGRYRYLRAPMGMSASSDEWCQRSDIVILGVPGTQKIVDDILICAPNPKELLVRGRVVLSRAREMGIAISRKKFQIGDNVSFAGFEVDSSGVRPDPERISALRDFPRPSEATEVRQFLGLAQQMGSFIPDLAHMSNPLRKLLHADVAFVWLEEHEEAFVAIKDALSKDLAVCHFDPTLRTTLLCDASKLKGLGFALIQKRDDDDFIRLVQCGSRSLSDAETRYATIELEARAIHWAIAKCKHYLIGMSNPFSVVTDHRPLVGIFQKDLDDVDNVRIQRMRERLTAYNFTVSWVPGAGHIIADTLSRNPVFQPDEEDEEEAEQVAKCSTVSTPGLDFIKEAAVADKEYSEVRQSIMLGKEQRHFHPDGPERDFQSMWNDLSVEDALIIYQGKKIVVPKEAQQQVLKLLHTCHVGTVKMQVLARQLYYWKGMSTDIIQFVRTCEPCANAAASQQKEPELPVTPYSELFPMAEMGADLFEFKGDSYLCMVDRYSGFLFADKLNALSTSFVTRMMTEWFNDFGWPLLIKSDFGPQFRSEFSQFCRMRNIRHEVSSAYHPQGNGISEAAVKQAKALLTKCGSGEKFKEALLEYRNTPRSDGFSPAQMFFGRRLNTTIPVNPEVLRATVPRDEAARPGRTRTTDVKKTGMAGPRSWRGSTSAKGFECSTQRPPSGP